MDDGMLSYHGAIGKFKHDVTIGSTSWMSVTVFGEVCQNAALGVKSVIYDCLVISLVV